MELKSLKKFEKNMQKHEKVIIFLIFLGILIFLILTSFSDNIPFAKKIITGEFIKNNFNDENATEKTIKFESGLTVPELSLKGEFEKIELSGSSNSFLYFGNQKFELGKINNNFFVFKNFKGMISFDEEKITGFDGKVSEVTINGILVEPIKETAKVGFGELFNYKSLEITREVSIEKLTYMTSGLVKLNNGGEIFNLNNDEITIENFRGNLIIDKGKFNAKGEIKKLSIIGESKINIQA